MHSHLSGVLACQDSTGQAGSSALPGGGNVDMRSKSRPKGCYSEEDIRGLAKSLSTYALGLSERERHALYEILLRAMAPLDRFHYLKASDLLSPDEEAVLRSLEKGSRRG